MLVYPAAASGDRRAALEAVRDRLAAAVDGCESMRDLPALTRQLGSVLEQIEALDVPDEEKVRTPLDDLAARRSARGSGAKRSRSPEVAQ